MCFQLIKLIYLFTDFPQLFPCYCVVLLTVCSAGTVEATMTMCDGRLKQALVVADKSSALEQCTVLGG